MAERASNAVESYNRSFCKLFLNGQPNISASRMVIREKFEFYSERYILGVFYKPTICSKFLAWKNKK
ncbi:hypothetical protein HZS_1900 [Henneguya salminicola]|nr:hypothetical protein HZS_1900 [Henneguya salminicola]